MDQERSRPWNISHASWYSCDIHVMHETDSKALCIQRDSSTEPQDPPPFYIVLCGKVSFSSLAHLELTLTCAGLELWDLPALPPWVPGIIGMHPQTQLKFFLCLVFWNIAVVWKSHMLMAWSLGWFCWDGMKSGSSALEIRRLLKPQPFNGILRPDMSSLFSG